MTLKEQKHTNLSYALQLGLLAFSLSIEAALSSNAEFLQISIASLTINEETKRVTLVINVTNKASIDILRVSHFSLETIVRNSVFYDTGGRVWELSRPHHIIDPPPVKEDYALEIGPAASKSVRFEFQSIKPFKKADEDRGNEMNSTFPTILEYLCFGEVATTRIDYTSSRWFVAAGRGQTKVALLRNPRPRAP